MAKKGIFACLQSEIKKDGIAFERNSKLRKENKTEGKEDGGGERGVEGRSEESRDVGGEGKRRVGVTHLRDGKGTQRVDLEGVDSAALTLQLRGEARLIESVRVVVLPLINLFGRSNRFHPTSRVEFLANSAHRTRFGLLNWLQVRFGTPVNSTGLNQSGCKGVTMI